MSIPTHYDIRLVALSVVIASLAAYIALDLAGRRTVASKHTRMAWWVSGAVVTAMGIWGMLGSSVPAAFGLAFIVTASALGVLGIGVLRAAMDREHGKALADRIRVDEARYRSLTQAATDAILCVEKENGSIVSWNIAAERIFGFAASDIIGRPVTTLIPSEHHGTWLQSKSVDVEEDAVASPGSTIEISGLRRDGTTFPMEMSLSAWSDGPHRFFTSIIRDLTDRKMADERLRETERRFRDVVEQSPEVIILHADGILLYANPAFARLIGSESAAELNGQPLVWIIHPDSRQLVASRQKLTDDSRRGETLHYQILHCDGRAIAVEATSVPTVVNGEPALQTHLRDVTSQRALEAQLAHQAFHDALTGLANRALFRDRVDHAITCASRRGAPPAVLFLDLDNFKAINDGLGHSAGDDLLCTVASRLLGVMRASDTCARLGGDEFAVLIEEPRNSSDAAANAAHIAERVLAAIGAPCMLAGAEMMVTVSIGIAVARPEDTGEELLRNADLAMYRAKSSGKSRYEMFEQAMHDVVRKRLELESDLRRAVEACGVLSRDECGVARPAARETAFVMHYQPIASLDSGEVRNFEALVRWKHPRHGLIAPMDFIPIAEETGLIVPLGRWILREACTQARHWQETGCGGADASKVGVTVNLSARQLIQAELVDDVCAALETSGLAAECLTLEMTETMLIDDSDAMLTRLRALKALGVRLAIDDFGTGYSSLCYLERFPVDVLKIDRSFVDKIGLGESESPLARAILGLGRELGMRVVAEGIETKVQWARLRELGCELGQGFYLARPKPASEIGTGAHDEMKA